MQCGICYEELGEEYAKINNDGESGLYHVSCLEEWISKSTNGILTQDKISSYLIVNGDSSKEIKVNDEESEPLLEPPPYVFTPPLTPASPPQVIVLNENHEFQNERQPDRGFRYRLIFCVFIAIFGIALFMIWRMLLNST